MSDTDWDLGMLNLDLDEQEACFDAITNLPHDKPPSAFDEFGDYNKRVVMQSHDVLYSWDTSQHVIDASIMVYTYNTQSLDLSHPPAPNPLDPTLDILPTLHESHTHEINNQAPDYQALMPMFGWLPADVIKQTFAMTTQYAHLPMSTLLKKRYKSLFLLLMSTGGMSWLQRIPSTRILPLLTLVLPLLKSLLVLNHLSQMFMPLKLIGNSSILWKTKSRHGEP